MEVSKLRESVENVISIITKTSPFLVLPVPPSDNERLISDRKGNLILSDQARQYLADIRELLHDRKPYRPTEDRPIILIFRVHFENRRRDASNIVKILKDSLEGSLYDKDKYVYCWGIPGNIDRKAPRVEIWFVKI